jgi:hypothetical protein
MGRFPFQRGLALLRRKVSSPLRATPNLILKAKYDNNETVIMGRVPFQRGLAL